MKTPVLFLILLSLQTPAFAQGSPDSLGSPGPDSAYDVLRHQEVAMNVLLGWSGASVASGTVMVMSRSPVLRGFGIQNIAWGVIDAGIAIFAKKAIAEKRLDGYAPAEEIRSFRKILLINTLLDILYVGVGIALAASGKENLRGHGYGVIVQGSFLFIFDLVNYRLAAG